VSILDYLTDRLHGATWPPDQETRDRWEKVQEYRLRLESDGAQLLQNNPYINAKSYRVRTFTPVPLARELARYSAALLFSDPPKVTLPDEEEKARRRRVELRQAEKDARNPFLPGSPANKARDEGTQTDVDEDGNPLPPEKPPTAALRPARRQSRRQKMLEDLLDYNALDAFLQETAERVAAEGRVGIRIIRDDAVSEGKPYLTAVPDDKIIWKVLHGRAVVGGVCVFEWSPPKAFGESLEIWRLLEEHAAGYVERRVYRGTFNRLGRQMGWESRPEEWEGLLEYQETGLDVPTLVRWDNVPGGHSDIKGNEIMLDRLDEAESLLLDKARKSVPIVFVHRDLADENGEVDLEAVQFTKSTGEGMEVELGQGISKAVEVAQPGFQSKEHIEWVSHLREMIALHSGYSQASWGIGESGRSDSGTALQLRQARTLLTKAGKDRMAREAIRNALAIALAWLDNAQAVADYRPEVMLGEGLPEDTVERANELSTRKTAGILSLRQAIRESHPDWTEDQVDEELELIEEDKPMPVAPMPGMQVVQADGEEEEDSSDSSTPLSP
jgi:hypothetical protein